MKHINILFFLLIVGTMVPTGCSQKSNANQMSSCAVKIAQGIYGRVFWQQGNQMPGPSKNKTNGAKPVKRQILVYPLINRSQLVQAGGLYQMPAQKPIAKTESDKDGCFQLKLPAGKYSVFTQEKKGLFANMFDGQGNVSPVLVKNGDLTELNITINYKAFF